MEKQIITVFGATGAQGSGVVTHLLKQGKYAVRAVTRNIHSEKAVALKEMGCEVVEADLNDKKSLDNALKNAYGCFVVTNAWEPTGQVNEFEQGKKAVAAAKENNVQHFVWSTLPNCKEISSGKYIVTHFTEKASVDQLVKNAGFSYYSFVEAPMYFQNLITILKPVPQEDGSKAWFFTMDPDNKGIYNGDIYELGKLVTAVFENRDKVGKGQYLAMSPGSISWNEIVAILQKQGHNIQYHQVDNETFEKFPIPAAKEFNEMLHFWEEYGYFGPNSEEKILLAKEIVPEGFTSFEDWAKENFKD